MSNERLDEILRNLEEERKHLEEQKNDLEKAVQRNNDEVFSIRTVKRLLDSYQPKSTYDRT